MSIQLYNTIRQQKELFVPLQPGRVGMYVCGVTVYDYCHIGHARVMVVFDVVVRHFQARGFQVTYVRNFTDIDDKIIRRANEREIPIGDLTAEFIAAFNEDMESLGVQPAHVEPKATEHLPQMQAMIQTLMDKGLAYESGGDVFYSVNAFADYGRLSGRQLEEMEAGARVEVDQRKEHPMDFVLWKASKEGEPAWESPWGAGRPGWHIECSAMSCHYLSQQFDIHGGGRDLIFPHHENEIAQSEGASGQPWVRYWIHNGFVNVLSEEGESEKMSKSLGNFMTIRELLERFSGEALRLFILNAHYRSPLDFSLERVAAAAGTLDRFYTALRGAAHLLGEIPAPVQDSGDGSFADEVGRFFAAMDDDFNTPQALAALHDLARGLNQAIDQGDRPTAAAGAGLLRGLGANLGLLGEDPDAYFQDRPGLSAAEVEALIQRRIEARKGRDFAEADRIRDHLKAQGVLLEDSRDGTTWRRER